MKLYKLNKTVLSVQNNAARFLNGLTSNTLDRPNNAFLNIHGRVIATFDQIQIAEDHFLILIEGPFVEAVLQHIDRYVKLSGTKLEKKDLNVYFDLDNTYSLSDGEWTIPQKKGKIIITSKKLDSAVTEEEFLVFRVTHKIPQHGLDYHDEMLLNISTEDFVSFTKGCYLGQEPISKVYNRSKPTWKLVVREEDSCTEEERQKMTSKVANPATGRIMGFVFVSNKSTSD
ncbi:MAG: hypothetical protein KC618_03640 [Candidatus Omnitrophica bacterium]|nr:hypothetical protein [Candidatus Omnitrophota bacterium]